jgi:DNA-binding PadR family transcriptional regulator
MERKGLIASRLQAGDVRRAGRPRRHYTIEAKGLRALDSSRAATRRLWAGVRLPLKGTA